MNLDKLPVRDAITLMLSEERKVTRALLAQRLPLEKTVRAVARAFRQGGRLIYVGAGSSGRLGVLDASECPPTFRVPPEMVQGIIAGGEAAMFRAVEGMEDDAAAGARVMIERKVENRDVVVGIAASGTTPFAWGALGEARRRGATTVFLCFNPHLKIPRDLCPDILIAANVGPEILTGSTRLKAGTATKIALNIISTLAMVQIGKVVSNLMVDLVPSNAKLRARAVRIVQTLTDESAEMAEAALRRSDWVIKTAVERLNRK